MKSYLKWKPAKTIYPNDHIISSKAREVGNYGFKPPYENDKHINMCFIMSNEYMRIWFKERQLYEKENYSKVETTKTESKMKRRFVQRMMTAAKRDPELPAIKLKRFQNIMAKVDTRRSADARLCDRYKNTFLTVEQARYKPDCKQQSAAIASASEENK